MNTIDQWTQVIGGVQYVVRLVPDYDSKPTDYDCYSQADITAWKSDLWSYVTVLVSPEITGLDAEWFDAASNGVEYGVYYAGSDDNIRENVVPMLAYEVWTQPNATARLASLRDQLAKILLAL